MLATIMQALDTTIANVALPYMQGSLSVTIDQVNWVLTSYIVAAAIMTAPVGWLAVRYGRKRVFIISAAGFTVASILCGAAQGITDMVLFRMLQGLFGAALVPLSQAIMMEIYPPEKRGQAMAIWGMGVMLGPIMGPTLGGWLTESYSWRWVFLINLPFGIATVLGLMAFLHDSKPRDIRFDWFGFITLSVAIGALQLMLDRGETLDWFSSSEVVIEAIIAAGAAYLFLAHTLTYDRPFVPPALFKDMNFTLGVFFMFIVGILILATIALVTPFLQNMLGYMKTNSDVWMGWAWWSAGPWWPSDYMFYLDPAGGVDHDAGAGGVPGRPERRWAGRLRRLPRVPEPVRGGRCAGRLQRRWDRGLRGLPRVPEPVRRGVLRREGTGHWALLVGAECRLRDTAFHSRLYFRMQRRALKPSVQRIFLPSA